MNNGTGEKLFFLITAAIMMYALVYVYYLPEKIFHHIKREVVIPRPSTINDVIITNNEYPFFPRDHSPIRHRWWHQRHHIPHRRRRPLRPFVPSTPRRHHYGRHHGRHHRLY